MTALLIALAALLLVVLAYAGVRIEALHAEVAHLRARGHASCFMTIQEVVSGAHDAALLNRLADRWDSAEEQGNLRILAREKYSPGGPSMPALWLKQQARFAEDRAKQAVPL